MSETSLDPFTKKLLEKTRQRRAQLHEKLQSNPAAAPRKRKPLQIDTSQNSDVRPILSDNQHEEKRRRSSTNAESITLDGKLITKTSPGGVLSTQNDTEDSGLDSEYERRQMSYATSSDEPSPSPATRKGRLAKLAEQINGWEEDLNHPTHSHKNKEESKKKVWQPPKAVDVEQPAGARPAKPQRTYQHTEMSRPTRSSPRFTQQQAKPEPQQTENNAFKFGTPNTQQQKTGSGATRQPPPPPVSKPDDPAMKSVSDRFAIWEKKSGDSCGPMRTATPLKAATPLTTRSRSGNNLENAAPVFSQQAKTTEFKPSPVTRTHQRNNSATPNSVPERERTGAAPWDSKPATSDTPGHQQDDQWAKARRTKETTFDTAPMSARKNAWEAKIAEQQTVAEEHNRIMYKTHSKSKLTDSSQKQTAVKQLQRGQEKVYDPAEKAKLERQEELKALQNRFNDKGLLQTEKPSSKSKTVMSSTESLEDQEYYTATETDNEKEEHQTKPSASIDARKVSFKTVGQRRKSDSPVEEERDVRDKKLSRRSSCKIPALGYCSSSEEDSVETTPVPKLFGKSASRSDSGSPNKIPRLGDESSADSQDDMSASRHTSASSIASSASEASYHVSEEVLPSNEIDDLLDQAMSDEEPTPPPRKMLSPRRRTPEQRKASSTTTSVYSIDAYRKKDKSVAKFTPIPAPRHPASLSSYEESDSDSVTSVQMSDRELRKRIKELQEFVQQEQSVIVQTSNALNQCCQGGMSFAGSTEQVECNRLLLISCQKRQAYLGEIERLKSNVANRVTVKGKGSLTISDIQLPLKRDFVKKIGSLEDTTVHYFLVMLKNRAQVIVTQMVSTHDALMRGTLHMPNLIKLNDIMNDFKFELEIYSMQVSREPIRTPSKKDRKKILSRSKSISVNGTPGGSQVRTTNFTHITSLPISMACVKQSSFTLQRVPYLSPLQGTIQMKLRCTMESNVVHRGFVNMFEDVGGFGAWHRRWCALNNNRVCYWKYPDDEKDKEPMGQISLKDCVTTEISLVSRDKCARPNTIEIVIVRPASKADSSSMNKQLKDRLVQEQHWFGMDTKDDRLEWCSKLNEALANVRQWYADAAQPVPAKRTVI